MQGRIQKFSLGGQPLLPSSPPLVPLSCSHALVLRTDACEYEFKYYTMHFDTGAHSQMSVSAGFLMHIYMTH